MGNVALKLGMIHPGKGTNTVRAVFIIDPEGFIADALLSSGNWQTSK